MAVPVVDLLEAIDVDHQEADRMAVPPRARGPFTLDELREVMAV